MGSWSLQHTLNWLSVRTLSKRNCLAFWSWLALAQTMPVTLDWFYHIISPTTSPFIYLVQNGTSINHTIYRVYHTILLIQYYWYNMIYIYIIHIHIYMYIYICICICAYIYIYIYIQTIPSFSNTIGFHHHFPYYWYNHLTLLEASPSLSPIVDCIPSHSTAFNHHLTIT